VEEAEAVFDVGVFGGCPVGHLVDRGWVGEECVVGQCADEAFEVVGGADESAACPIGAVGLMGVHVPVFFVSVRLNTVAGRWFTPVEPGVLHVQWLVDEIVEGFVQGFAGCVFDDEAGEDVAGVGVVPTGVGDEDRIEVGDVFEDFFRCPEVLWVPVKVDEELVEAGVDEWRVVPVVGEAGGVCEELAECEFGCVVVIVDDEQAGGVFFGEVLGDGGIEVEEVLLDE